MGAGGPALGLDYGTRRIGLAVSDAEGRFAFPAGTLERHSTERDLEALARLVDERGIRRIVMGLPLHLDGRAGEMVEAVRAFAGLLAERTGLAVALLDERWTSQEAERAVRDVGGSRKKASKKRKAERPDRDSIAASILLRTWLEREAGSA